MSPIPVAENEPFVSVVTPVLNGEKYLPECIESILAQTYQNWEYIIVDNCSEDRTKEIAESYAAQDERIRVYDNLDHSSVIPDWNYSMRLISPNSVYCKVVHADDWLFPNCISEMVSAARESDSIGLVSAYRLNGKYIDLDGLPYPSRVTSGKEIGRLSLTRNPLWLFGSPSSVMYRADLVRDNDPFYDESILHADTDVCFKLMQNYDFGFVHKVLTYTRYHEESISTTVADQYSTLRMERLRLIRHYGPIFLGEDEYARLEKDKISQYHAYLAGRLFEHKPDDFWEFQRRRTQELGIPLQRRLFIKPLVREVICRLMPVSCR